MFTIHIVCELWAWSLRVCVCVCTCSTAAHGRRYNVWDVKQTMWKTSSSGKSILRERERRRKRERETHWMDGRIGGIACKWWWRQIGTQIRCHRHRHTFTQWQSAKWKWPFQKIRLHKAVRRSFCLSQLESNCNNNGRNDTNDSTKIKYIKSRTMPTSTAEISRKQY